MFVIILVQRKKPVQRKYLVQENEQHKKKEYTEEKLSGAYILGRSHFYIFTIFLS